MVTSHTLIRNSLLTIAIAGIFCCLALVAQAYHMVLEIESEVAEQTAMVADSLPLIQKEVMTDREDKVVVDTMDLPEIVEEENAEVSEAEAEPSAKEETKPVAVKEEPKEVPKAAPVAIPSKAVEKNFDQELIDLIVAETNAFRVNNDLSPLKYEPVLAGNAKAYSQEMLRGDFMSHTDRSGCDLTCRFKQNGYQASSWGENLATIKFDDWLSAREVADYFMKGWKKSAGHRDNLLSEDFVYQGIGVSYSDHAVYVSVQFAKQ